MNQSDAYYRAWLAYREQLCGRRDCARDSRAFAEADGRGAIRVTRAVCTVDEAWIHAIEEGLVHIEKAIKEERQFIHSNGEVIPIEKVKHVSKDSVEHLARHAELITRVEEGEDLTPDKLYTVERLSDYAVYENRFLYMLLCYLRDFVTLRYRRILELTNRYEGRLTVEKEVASFDRTVTLRVELHEERKDDPYLREHNSAVALIDRMDLILKTVLAFLATPLMESAGKAATLKPPITKTNVLKMDNNFKGAVALYDYIIAYEGPGYTVTEEVRELDPFRDGLSEDMAEAELLLSFLTHRYGLDLDAELKAAHERDEAQRRREELRQRTEQMEALRRRLTRDGQPLEAYILELEKQVRALQNEADRLEPLYAEIDARKTNERELTDTIHTLTARVENIDEERRGVENAHAEAMREAEQRHRREQSALKERQAAEQSLWQEEAERLRDRYRTEVADLQRALAATQAEMDRMTVALDGLTEEKRLLEARVWALRAQKRDISREEAEAMTDKESFDELERELETFIRFYKSEWSKTKRRIRKDLLNPKYIKGQNGQE